jgi:DNA replication and repair protein RecF
MGANDTNDSILTSGASGADARSSADEAAAAPKPASLFLEHLAVREFRNLERVDIEPATRVNVITGNNGQGKTSLLEAIYFAATSRSFRTHRVAELVRHGAAVTSVKARFTEHAEALAPLSREQTAAIEGKTCLVRIDGNRPQSHARFATRSPVVAFHPEELALSTGPAGLRRRLLDRIALFMDPASAEHRARYQHALRARQELLHKRSGSASRAATSGGGSDGGSGNEESAEVDAFEELCARHGAMVTRSRAQAADALAGELRVAFSQIAAPDLRLDIQFEPGGSADVEQARGELRRQRNRDAYRQTAGFGPHRDELALLFDSRPARLVGSQGQHRALTLALKAAEAATVAAVRGLEPILLLDDVSSELDPDRTAALFRFLGLARGQIFLTTTRRDLIVTPGVDRNSRRDFRIERGLIEPLPESP